MDRNVSRTIMQERSQSWGTRKKLFPKIEGMMGGRRLVTYFTSFFQPVQIDDRDCDMLQSILQVNDLSSGLILMISSPGGDGLAAERMVNICRSYSGTNDYWVIVPGKAKSAGTIVCMGASKIYMSPSSELGPVDPQIISYEDGNPKFFSAFSLVSTYENLFQDAVNSQGRIEPYIQQLRFFDAREVSKYKTAISLADDIVVKLMTSGTMAGMAPQEIRDRLEVFLNPEAGTLSHGRPIYAAEARGCGLPVEDLDVKTDLWRTIYELYARTESYVTTQVSKAAESRADSFFVPAFQAGDEP